MTSALLRHQQHESGLETDTLDRPSPLLDHLRHVARDARCKSYVDLFGACAALSANRHVAEHAASEILVRCLSQALDRHPILFREGECERSFDEDWLVSLARSIKTGDEASTTFLLHSRVPKQAHRNLVFLLGNVADNFTRI
jgi:hypothetical protein